MINNSIKRVLTDYLKAHPGVENNLEYYVFFNTKTNIYAEQIKHGQAWKFITTMICAEVSDPLLRQDYYQDNTALDPGSENLILSGLAPFQQHTLQQLVEELKNQYWSSFAMMRFWISSWRTSSRFWVL